MCDGVLYRAHSTTDVLQWMSSIDPAVVVQLGKTPDTEVERLMHLFKVYTSRQLDVDLAVAQPPRCTLTSGSIIDSRALGISPNF